MKSKPSVGRLVLLCPGPLPAQGAPRLGVVLVVVQPQQQLGQVRVDLVVAYAGQDLEQQEGLPAETLRTHTHTH